MRGVRRRLVFVFRPPLVGPFVITVQRVTLYHTRVIVSCRKPIPLSLDWIPRDLRYVIWPLLDNVDKYVIECTHGIPHKAMNVHLTMDCIHMEYHKLLKLFGSKPLNKFACCRTTNHKVIKTLRKLGWLKYCSRCIEVAVRHSNIRILQEFMELPNSGYRTPRGSLLGLYIHIWKPGVDWQLVLDWLQSKNCFAPRFYVQRVISENRLDMMEYLLKRNLVMETNLLEMCANNADMFNLVAQY